MIALSLLVFIMLTNLWDQGYIGICTVAGQRYKKLAGIENSTITFVVIMPHTQSENKTRFVALVVGKLKFAAFRFKSKGDIIPSLWFKNSTNVTRVLGRPRKKYTVVFNPLKDIHAGAISCYAGLNSWSLIPGCGQGITITVIRKPDPPSVSIFSGSAQIGDNLTLECPSRSRSLPVDHTLNLNIYWKDVNGVFNNTLPHQRLKILDHGLKIMLEKVSILDNGLKLQCATEDIDNIFGGHLKSEFGPVYTITPETKSKFGCTHYPELRTLEKVVEKEEGHDATMLAIVDTCGKLSWHRYILSNLIPSNHYKYDIIYGPDRSWLTIKNVTQADAGFYICRAVNDYGSEAQLIFHLKVKRPVQPSHGNPKPILTLDDKDKKIIHGDDFNLTCHVKPALNMNQFEWQIINGRSYFSSTGENYTVKGNDIDIGKHRAWCRATSDSMQDWTAKSESLDFSVIPATPKLTPSVLDNVIFSPTPLTLSCKTGDDVAGVFYNFYKDYRIGLGKKIPSFHTEPVTYTVSTLQAEPAAVYTCTATVNNLESLHSSEKKVTVKTRPKTPKLTSNVEDSVIKVNTKLTLNCYSESELSAAADNKTTIYSFFKDGQKVTSNTILGEYEVPTGFPVPTHVYTCTVILLDNSNVESLHSPERKLTIVGNLPKPNLSLPHAIIDRESFNMSCTSRDSRATLYRFIYGTLNYDSETRIYTVINSTLGKQTASCQYFIGEVGSPQSAELEVKVRPKTPTLTPNIQDSIVSVGDQLTLTCDTDSFYPNARQFYKFFKFANHSKIQISDGFVNTYNVPTRSIADLTDYTCTVTMRTVESFHSVTYSVQIVFHKKPSLTVNNKSLIHGGSFKLTCSVQHENAVGFLFYYKDTHSESPITKASNYLTVERPAIGKYEARCRFEGTDGSRSPSSEVVEVKVLPKTPRLSANLPDSEIRVTEKLILTCSTDSVVNPKNYSFYSDNTLTPGSPSHKNKYQVSTNDSFPEVAYTCTVTIASVESLHSSKHRVTIYAPWTTAAVIFAILIISGCLLLVCLIVFLCLRKRHKKDEMQFFSVRQIIDDSAINKNSDRNTQGPLPDESTFGVMSDMSKLQGLKSYVVPEQESRNTKEQSKLSDTSKAQQSQWQNFTSKFGLSADRSDEESTMNYLKSFDGWQSNSTGTDVDSVYEIARRESSWQDLKIKHLEAFIAERSGPQQNVESLYQHTEQESSLQDVSQGKTKKQADDTLTLSKRVPESCCQRLIPRCIRKKSETTGTVPVKFQQASTDSGMIRKKGPVPKTFLQAGPHRGKSSEAEFVNPSLDYGTSKQFPSYSKSGSAQTRQTRATADINLLNRSTNETLRSFQRSEFD